jgi:hypothetical protein
MGNDIKLAPPGFFTPKARKYIAFETDPKFRTAFRTADAPLPDDWDNYDKEIDPEIAAIALAALAEIS